MPELGFLNNIVDFAQAAMQQGKKQNNAAVDVANLYWQRILLASFGWIVFLALLT